MGHRQLIGAEVGPSLEPIGLSERGVDLGRDPRHIRLHPDLPINRQNSAHLLGKVGADQATFSVPLFPPGIRKVDEDGL